MGLSFLFPVFLVGAAAIAIPLVLHLFRRKTEVVVDFPAVRLIETTPVNERRRRRLRELILLALRIVALVLLAVAFARPFFEASTSAVPVPVTVVTLDKSLSLSAPGQFERARAAARRVVEDAPATHTVALVTFADAATLVVPPTTDRGDLATAIDRAVPSASGTRFRTALAAAAEAMAGHAGRIVVVTDLQQAGWDVNDEGAVPDGIEVEVVEVGGPPGNVVVTSVRRDGDGVVAGIHNYAAETVRSRVTLRVGEKELASQRVEIAPQGSADVRMNALVPAAGAAEIRVDDASGYQGDNSRYFLLDPPPAVPIIVVTADPPGSSNAGLYVERALSVAEQGRAFAVRVMDGRGFSELSSSDLERAGALVILGTTTLDRAGRERIAAFLSHGGQALVTLGPDIDLETLPDTLGTAIGVEPDATSGAGSTVTLVAVDTRHPIFRPFVGTAGSFGDVYVARYRRLKEEKGRTVLARFAGAGEALFEQPVGKGRLLVFASDLDNRWNRFPLNPSFVPWAVETMRYLSRGRERRRDFTLPDVPPGVPSVPGVHRVDDRPITVNVDVRESNPARMSAEAFTSGVVRLAPSVEAPARIAAREQEDSQRLWQIGLALMLVVLAGEGLIGRKAA